MEAQILKISLLGANHGGFFVGSMHIPVCQKKNFGYVTAMDPKNTDCAEKDYCNYLGSQEQSSCWLLYSKTQVRKICSSLSLAEVLLNLDNSFNTPTKSLNS